MTTTTTTTLRCRYEDCREGHPVAEDGEQVTCARCRVWMGLPPLVRVPFDPTETDDDVRMSVDDPGGDDAD